MQQLISRRKDIRTILMVNNILASFNSYDIILYRMETDRKRDA